jgi:ssDNA-binding Zn-finger/Zn-ribbon topoisomerase 1
MIVVPCPDDKCKGRMKHKTWRRGEIGRDIDTGHFYGCSEFPRCRCTMSVSSYKREEHNIGCGIIGEPPDDPDVWGGDPH